MESIFNYKVSEIRSLIIEKPNWGAYFVIDDFLNRDFFYSLCKSYNVLKVNKDFFTQKNYSNVWRKEESKGINYMFGGGGESINAFKEITEISEDWKNFLEKIYSSSSLDYFKKIFSLTKAFHDNISNVDLQAGVIGCKLSSQTNNFGDRIHQDTTKKVFSYLLYLDNVGWIDGSKGGTDLWEVTNKDIPYNNNLDSIDRKLREGRFSPDSHSLKHSEASKLNKFLSIEFKPNRLIGFVRTDQSYHSVPPRILPENITRDCFQINIWNFNRVSKVSNRQKIINLPRKIYRKLISSRFY